MAVMNEIEDLSLIFERSKESGGTVLAVGHLGNQDISEIKAKVKNMVYNDMDKGLLSNLHLPDVQQQVKDYIQNSVLKEGENLSRIMRSKLLDVAGEIVDEVMGLGPIQDLLDDPEITEVMVNGPFQVYVERNGIIELTDITFDNNEQVHNIIDRIVSRIGRKIDESTPMVDARLPDGSRVNAVIPPLSLIGPVLTIRKFSKEPFSPFDLVFRFHTFSCREAYLFQQAVDARLNILVSGGTGSGKTKSGVSLAQALRLSLDRLDGPLKHEVEGIVKAIDFGNTARDALEMFEERIPAVEYKMVTVAVSVNSGLGGNLAEAFKNIAGTIAERRRIQEEAKSLSAQGKLASNAIALIIVGLVCVLRVLNPEYLDPFFGSILGMLIFTVAIGWAVLGWWLVRKVSMPKVY